MEKEKIQNLELFRYVDNLSDLKMVVVFYDNFHKC